MPPCLNLFWQKHVNTVEHGFSCNCSLWERGEGLAWLIGAVVCPLAALWVCLFSGVGNGCLRYHQLILISCHFRDCKALLVTSLSTHVSSAILSAGPLYFFTGHSRSSTDLNVDPSSSVKSTAMTSTLRRNESMRQRYSSSTTAQSVTAARSTTASTCE